MATAYLIGGAPRCGKTTICLETVSKHPMFSASTDSIRYVLKTVLSSEHAPDLFSASDMFTEASVVSLCTSGRAMEIVTAQNRESAEVWKSVEHCIEGYLAEDLDILIEGVAILPEQVSRLNQKASAVFIGNTDSNHAKHMLAYARSGSYDWLSTYSDEAILAFGQFTRAFSEFLRDECAQYNFPFYDLAAGDFEQQRVKAINDLLAVGRQSV